jgi:hypothetical protein
MIQARTNSDGSALVLWATAEGFPVYLDNWAIYDLAEGDPSRRNQFVSSVRSGAELLFSIANAVELTGPKGKSFELVKGFLDELGPHWVPIEMNPFEVLEREQRGVGLAESCISEGFMNAYLSNRIADCPGKVVDLGPDFFRLGVVLDWFAQNKSLPEQLLQFDNLLRMLSE